MEQLDREAEGEDEGIVETKVVTNEPKRPKIDETFRLPAGMVRCNKCGGWGKDLVQAHGYCKSCYRNINA